MKNTNTSLVNNYLSILCPSAPLIFTNLFPTVTLSRPILIFSQLNRNYVVEKVCEEGIAKKSGYR